MSKRHIILYFCLLVSLVVTACAEDETPKDLLTHAQMVPVLADLQIAYAGVDQTVKDPKERMKKYDEMNSMILKKHTFNHDQFYNSYKWYEADPQQLDTIFKQVVTNLNEQLADLRSIESGKPRAKVPEIK